MENLSYINVDAQMHHFETWVFECTPQLLNEKLEAILTESQFTIVNFLEHKFPVQGYTCVWLLAESHLAVHTFPESDKSFIQLSSCNLEKLERFKNSIELAFK